MNYITNKRLKTQTLSGQLNIPYGTSCTMSNNIIFYKDKPICFSTSQIAYDYLSRDDDGHGLERGKLVDEIKSRLAKNDENHQARWDKIWDNEARLGKFRRQDIPDHWLWSFEFYNAEIVDLQFILNLIKEVK